MNASVAIRRQFDMTSLITTALGFFQIPRHPFHAEREKIAGIAQFSARNIRPILL